MRLIFRIYLRTFSLSRKIRRSYRKKIGPRGGHVATAHLEWIIDGQVFLIFFVGDECILETQLTSWSLHSVANTCEYCKILCPCSRQKFLWFIHPVLDHSLHGLKTIPWTAAHTPIIYIWEFFLPPPRDFSKYGFFLNIQGRSVGKKQKKTTIIE